METLGRSSAPDSDYVNATSHHFYLSRVSQEEKQRDYARHTGRDDGNAILRSKAQNYWNEDVRSREIHDICFSAFQ